MIFRGREMAHTEIGARILHRLAGEVAEVANIEVPPKQEGMTMVQILAPKKDSGKKDSKKEPKKDQKKARAGADKKAAAGSARS